MRSLKKRVFEIIEIGSRDDKASRTFDYFITIVIFLNLFTMFIETFDYPEYFKGTLVAIEYVTLGIFIVEYALRVWTAPLKFPQKSTGTAVLMFIFSFYGIVDLLTILPYFLLMLPSGIAAFRMLRIIRVFRLFRINAQYDAFNVILDVLNERKSQLLSSISLIVMVMMCSSMLMYSIEHPLQPDVYRNALSGLWWSVSAIFTVGYGDIYPISTLGQVVAIIISFLGIMLVAIPTGIISAGFVDHFSKIKELSSEVPKDRMKFLKFDIEKAHPWVGVALKDIKLPPELTVAIILRGDQVVIPRGATIIEANDAVVLGAVEYDEGIDVLMREETIHAKHPWKDKMLMELSLPADLVIVSVTRDHHVLVPRGDTRILEKDIVTYCSNYAK